MRLRKVYYERHENTEKCRAKGIPKDEPESTDAKVRRVKKDPEQKVQLEIKQ